MKSDDKGAGNVRVARVVISSLPALMLLLFSAFSENSRARFDREVKNTFID